jgi:4-alpha-glucanotransferase
MKFKRASGVILHPTSLAGEYGIGDLGPQARLWLDFLSECGCGFWQILPLGPTGFGDSPYQCFSAFAGNPYLISPDELSADGLLTPEDLINLPQFPDQQVDYGKVIPWKLALLDRAYARFEASATAAQKRAFVNFQQAQASWLEDFALFMAIKEYYGGGSWTTWPMPLRRREPAALEEISRRLAAPVQRQLFRQFIFFRQWEKLRQYAHDRDIQIIGDIPIFVAHDCAEVWAHPELFYLLDDGEPEYVAGVPPDYFSPTGQLWGNPLYRWDVHRRSGYRWWLQRLGGVLALVDVVRLDHFRGFAGYWEVPGGSKTAEYGRWVPGPGHNFFDVLEDKLGDLPIIAEDLGVITPDVIAMRETYNLPGMKVLQFAFSFGNGPSDPFLPHHYPVNCVAYTGTHDNDTVLGWYQRVPEDEKSFYRRYLNRDGTDVAWDLIRATWASVASLAIAPLQDFLSLDNRARMNVPGRPSGNWAWRMPADCLNTALKERIREVNYLYSRLSGEDQAALEAQSGTPDDYFDLPE